MEADWSSIPIDLLVTIGSNLDLAADRLRFCSVSRSWRSVLPPLPPPPWLVLSEPNVAEKHYAVEFQKIKHISVPLLPRGFVSLAEQKIFELDLPEAHERQIIGSRGTLLITVGLDGTINLLNPFTRIQIQLPSVTTFSNYDPKHHKIGRLRRDNLVYQIVLSSSTRDCIAMAFHGDGLLSFARPGDSSWTGLRIPEDGILDVIFYKEKFYAINTYGILIVCDINTGQFSMVTPKLELLKFNHEPSNIYLVEWMRELLLGFQLKDREGQRKYVSLTSAQRSREKMKRTEETVLYRTMGFKIYKLDFTNNKWEELKNLGEYSLFLGRNTSISILSSEHGGIRRNCIYFTDESVSGARSVDMSCGRDMGVFDVEKNDIQPHYRGISTSLYSPPLWLIPQSLASPN